MIGIYIIKNKINGKIYVGQAMDIEKRWGEHRRAMNYVSEHTYSYPLYRAMRKYGLDNFDFCVVDICPVDKLTEREQYWIEHFQSKVPQGYNQEDAIEPKRGEKCNFAVLSDLQAKEIIRLLRNTTMPMSEIAKIYKVSGSCIEDINKGRRRTQSDIEYPIRKNAKSIGHSGVASNNTCLTDEIVMAIRRRYVNETLENIWKDYKHLVGFSGIKKICYGSSWKHLPIYKKREKKWVTYDN